MSGGHFDYAQYRIGQIAEEVMDFLKDNPCEFSEETIRQFKEGVIILRQAEIYAQRIDWLISGDDGEDNFHERLREDLERLDYYI